MQQLSLAGHYHQTIDIDLCQNCCLIWFDQIESVKLAGPGIADLVHTIHAGVSAKKIATLPDSLPCPICQVSTKLVYNQTRFGRTRHLECPKKHGYFQTFVLYLAEKGFVRPMRWADHQPQANQSRVEQQQLFCAGCGAGLDDGLYDACPYCNSTIGVIDPARLASAIDIHQAAPHTSFPIEVIQSQCWSCGASVDETQNPHCPFCHVILRSKISHRATEASTSVEARVRQNYAHQIPEVSIKKLEQAEMYNAMTSSLTNKFDTHKGAALKKLIRPITIVIMLSVFLAGAFMQKTGIKFYKKPVSAKMISEKIALEEEQLTTSAYPSGSATNVTSVAAAESVAKAQPSYEEMFSFPKLICAADAVTRTEVKIRQIIVIPEKMVDAAGESVDHRKAYLQLQQARLALINETAFDKVLLKYGSRVEADGVSLNKFFKKGTTKAEIERVAFCLPINEVSPIFLTSEGFHLLQVVEAR